MSDDSAEYRYAVRLATYLWEVHWKDAAPDWKPLPDMMGVLTQIDNAVANLAKPRNSDSVTVELPEAQKDL
jgi:hypothetical protein